MDLKEWLFFNKMTIVELARILDYSRTHMVGIVAHRYNPSLKLVKRIESLTNGQVTAKDFKKYGQETRQNEIESTQPQQLKENISISID